MEDRRWAHRQAELCRELSEQVQPLERVVVTSRTRFLALVVIVRGTSAQSTAVDDALG